VLFDLRGPVLISICLHTHALLKVDQHVVRLLYIRGEPDACLGVLAPALSSGKADVLNLQVVPFHQRTRVLDEAVSVWL
jgi:hypothetical protein